MKLTQGMLVLIVSSAYSCDYKVINFYEHHEALCLGQMHT